MIHVTFAALVVGRDTIMWKVHDRFRLVAPPQLTDALDVVEQADHSADELRGRCLPDLEPPSSHLKAL